MKRNFTGWGVTIAGLILAGGGALAMWSGWDMILVERGWSLFIAGAVALSGGVVTIALGRVIATLGRLGSFAPATDSAGEGTHVAPPAAVAEPAPTPESAVPAGASVEASVSRLEPAPVERPVFAPPREPPPPPLRPHPAFSRGGPLPLRGSLAEATYAAPDPEPKEVDRYTAGDATYVMLSDGSVEVRGPGGVRRYASLAELKAQTAARSS